MRPEACVEHHSPVGVRRRMAAHLLRCDAGEITFTHNTTEAFNILAQGLPVGPGDEVVFSSLNHAGASQSWFHFAREKGFTVKRFQFPVLDVPNMSTADILNVYDEQLGSSTRVLVLPHVDNIVGFARSTATQHDGTEWRSPHSWELSSSLYAVGLRGDRAVLRAGYNVRGPAGLRAAESAKPESPNLSPIPYPL